MKRYFGTRTPNGCTVTIIDAEGGKEPLDPRFDLRRHSPGGFEFGYSGSGPGQLSLALLADVLGDDERAQRLAQDFKRKVVARLEGDHFELSENEIRQAVAQLEQGQRR